MRNEKEKNIKKISNVRIEINNVARLISDVKIENNNVASEKRDIANIKKKSDMYLKEKKIRNSKRRITKTRLV